MTWQEDVRRANEALDWIEARQGPLKPDGYARIETTVQQVRAMASEQTDDARISEIRARHEAATPGPWKALKRAPDWGATEIGALLDTPDARVIADTELWGRKPTDQNVQDAEFIAHAREDVPYLLARLDALTAEAADVARENEALIEEVKAAGEQIAALTAERDELRSAGLRLIEVRDRAVDGADHAFRERDAAVARAERAEAAIRAAISEIDRGCQWDARAALAAASEAAQEGRDGE